MAVTAALVATVVGPMGAATASAKTVTAADDTAAEFAQGTPSATVVRTLTAADGAVELSRTLEEQFAVAPAGWTSTTWATPPVVRPPTVVNGSLVVDGERADSGVTAGPGSSLEFTAIFGNQTFTHVGFATDFDAQPWAMFSTGPDGGGTVYARTSDGGGPLADINFTIPGVLATDPHTYRIDWTTSGFDYFVDGLPVVMHAIPLTVAMRAQASDFTPAGGGVSIDSMILNTHTTPGTFISRVLDAGDPRVTGLSFTATSAPSPGTTIAYETRTAASSGALATAPWAPVGADNTVTSPARQYLQYRATLTTTVPAATSRLDKVEVGFTVDDEPPVVTIDDVAVAGGTATVTFRSDDAAADVKCKLDGAALAACGSPKEFSRLAVGSHAVVVQATDAQGNVGSATRSFEVAAPPSGTTPPPSGGGTTPPPAGTAPDLTAPRVVLVQRTVRVSKGGVARIRVRCPATEVRCTLTVKLKLGGKTVARKTLTVRGGTTGALDLRLSSGARSALAVRSKVHVTAVVSATDAAANHRTTQFRMTLRAPSH